MDVILTNPPFGGEEETRHPGQLPRRQADQRDGAALPAAHHAQAAPPSGQTAGRAAVVVPNGTLFGDGVAARIKEELLKEFNLHTIVRLPNGVFAPYTSIPTNLLFFDRSGPTREVWYYEQPLPEGRKNYTKTKPLQFEEFADCLAWWNSREENERAWNVSGGDDPRRTAATSTSRTRAPSRTSTHLPPEQLAASILEKERRIAEIMLEVQALLRPGNAAMIAMPQRNTWQEQMAVATSKCLRFACERHFNAVPLGGIAQEASGGTPDTSMPSFGTAGSYGSRPRI